MTYKCFRFLYSYPKVTSIQTTTFCKFRYDNIQLLYSGLMHVGQGSGGPSLRSAQRPRFPRKRSHGYRGRAWSVVQVALNGHKPFRPSTTTKLTTLIYFFHIRVVTTSKLTFFFHPRVVTTSKLTIFFHPRIVTTSKLTIYFHPRVVTTSKLTIYFHPRVVTTSKLTIFFHPRVVTICFVQLQSYQDVELFPYFTQKKGFVSMHNSAIML
jgi:hypothetical protein